MRILLTNDDGIDSPGIAALHHALEQILLIDRVDKRDQAQASERRAQRQTWKAASYRVK